MSEAFLGVCFTNHFLVPEILFLGITHENFILGYLIINVVG